MPNIAGPVAPTDYQSAGGPTPNPPTPTPTSQPTTPLGINAFASAVKAKYPAYQNLDNATLVEKILAKYPQYSTAVHTPSAGAQKVIDTPTPSQNTVGNFFKALPGAALQVGVGAPAKLLASGAEGLATTIKTGGQENASGQTYKIPGLGPFKSFQSDAVDRAKAGQNPVLNAGQGLLETGLAGADTAGLAEGAGKLPELLSKLDVRAGGAAADRAIASSGKAALSSTVQDATPAYSKSLLGEPNVNPTTPRVTEGKVFKGRVVNPTQLETEAGQTLSKVPNYPANGTALEKLQVVKPEIARQGQALAQSLKNENILRPPQQIVKVVSDAVNNVPKESLLLQKSDPVISNYMRVVKNAVAQNDGTLAGELKVKQAMDAAYENARGKLAFGSDKISALDDVHKAGRDALTQDLINHARQTDVKAALKSQWDLFRAADVLQSKAETEAPSKMARFVKNYPKLANTIKYGAGAIGVEQIGKKLGIPLP